MVFGIIRLRHSNVCSLRANASISSVYVCLLSIYLFFKFVSDVYVRNVAIEHSTNEYIRIRNQQIYRSSHKTYTHTHTHVVNRLNVINKRARTHTHTYLSAQAGNLF